MNTENKSRQSFVWFAFIWSYLFWGIGILLSIKGNVKILENADLLKAILTNTLSNELRPISIVNTLAGYGPMLAAVFLYVFTPINRKYFNKKFKVNTPAQYALQIIALFILITLIPSVPLFIKSGLSTPLTWSLVGFLLLFFIYQFITAGTEEIGWRGFLLASMLKEKTPWQASVRIGIIWALWHTPIILYVFFVQGLPIYQIVFSFAGFIAGTIAMSVVHTYYYMKTNNILFNMFLHAVSNTLPMFVGLLFASSYEISVAVQVLLWCFVIFITKKNKVFFDTVQEHIY